MGKTRGAEDQTKMWGRLEELMIKPVGKTGGADDQTSGEDWSSLGSNQWGRLEELRNKPNGEDWRR